MLANDVDPAGGLLSVQRAEAVTDNQLDVAVVNGRWLRVSARQGELTPNPQIVRYTISNGTLSGIPGQVVVSQRPLPQDNTPVTQNDEVTVRAGTSQAFPVLDNDFSPSGGTLTLLSGGPADEPGSLDVQAIGAPGGPTGSAYVSGRTIRYVAPDLPDLKQFTIRYQAVNEQGDSANGKVRVTVLPLDTRDNAAPEPPVLEGRTVAGDTVKLRLPGYGVDPDGDAVTMLGLDSAPELGRVTRIGANSIEYNAYPGSKGTDDFTYTITDTFGATSTGTARVSITPPGPPQPPLAVPDSITVAPGRTAVVDVLANDLVATGSRVALSLVAPPPGVRLRSETGPLELDAPATVDGRSVEVVYRVNDGLDSSQTTVTLRTAKGYNNPPIVSDAFGSAGDGTSVTADVLSAGTDDDWLDQRGVRPRRPVRGPARRRGVRAGGDHHPHRRRQDHRRAGRAADGGAVPGRGRRRRRHDRVAVRAGRRLGPAVRPAGRSIRPRARAEAEAELVRLRRQPVGRPRRLHPEEPDVGLAADPGWTRR